MREIIMKAQRIQKFYRQTKVLSIPSFELYAGAFNLLLGANGSGKTTLMKILSLVDEDFSGQLWYRDQEISSDELSRLEVRRRFSVIWQNPYLYAGTVESNIGLPLALRGMDKSEIVRRVSQLAAELEISHLLSKNSKALSAGEKQKVSIARSMITGPEILFIDEPTTNLDYESTRFYNDYFTRQVERGMTVLLITHDVYQIETLAQFVTRLKDGVIVECGSKDSIILHR